MKFLIDLISALTVFAILLYVGGMAIESFVVWGSPTWSMGDWDADIRAVFVAGMFCLAITALGCTGRLG